MNLLFKKLKPAPHLPEIANTAIVKEKYNYWRIRILYSMFIGYAFYYFSRKSFVFAMPGIMQELQLDKSQLGIVSSIFALTYGISKFASGVLSDQSNPRYFMAFGLICSGILTIFVGFSSSLYLFAILWGLNGWFQGFGSPPCVRLLSHWYSHSERGSWWSSWTVSQNVGAFLIPWIAGICLHYYNWQLAMFAPGLLCILGGFFLINRLADTPQSLGLPPIEKFRNDYISQKRNDHEEEELSTRSLLLSVLKNKCIWILAVAYFFIYTVRVGIESWTALFMIESEGYTPIYACGLVSLFEVGGFFGGLSVGWISDRLFNAKRGPVNALFAIVLLVSILSFWSMPKGCAWLNSSVMFIIGFATFGPQMLIGIAVTELAHKKASATANGFAGWVAYIGAASAGFPLGKIIDYLGWKGFFLSMILCSGISITLLLWSMTFSLKKEMSQISP
ncbi:MAG: MFS transporter [Chlamydiales bacterium]|nr:MFS transporter [Chlamydiales bacterium]